MHEICDENENIFLNQVRDHDANGDEMRYNCNPSQDF